MKMRKILPVLYSLFAGSLLLGGCSSSSSSTPGGGGGPSTQSISGIVSDPAIADAEVILVNQDGSLAGISSRSDADGRFSLTGLPLGSLSGYRLKTVSGADIKTGQDFKDIELCLPLSMYAQYENVVVSPLTCLVDAALSGSDLDAAMTAVKGKLGELDLSTDPATNLAREVIAMKLSLFLAEGKSFAQIWEGLDSNPGLDEADLVAIFAPGTARDRLSALFLLIDTLRDTSGATVGDVAGAIQKARIESAIRKSLATGRKGLSDATQIANFETNVQALVAHLILLKDAGTAARSYLMEVDVVSTISSGGGICFADERNLPCAPERKMIATTFNPAAFINKLVLVNRASAFVDSLKIAYYRVDNPLTGNEQLVVYDGVTQQQTVVKTNVILGSRTFVFEGNQEGDKRVITGKKYGILLDPNLAQENRTAPDGRGGFFQYTFFLDNAFKRFDVGSPSSEQAIFNSSMLSQALKNQGVDRIASQYALFNNTNDPDNSYVELAAFERLPDLNRGETGSKIQQAPVAVRLFDGKMTQGRLIRILKDPTTGLTNRVLVNFEAVHTPSSALPFDARLQVCSPDLSGCADVPGGGGGFYALAENSAYVYLAKEGENTLYAFDKFAESVTAVTGVQYPAVFDPAQHLIGAAGHGGGGILSDFSSIAGANTYLSDGPNAYLAINYDLDRNTEVGAFQFLGPIFVQKHAQILKLSGTSGVKMFDNGDGIDNGDASSDIPNPEKAVGHANLIAVKNGKLFVEIANYDSVSAGGTCVPNTFGYYCFSVRYGYLNTADTGLVKTDLDTILVGKEKIRHFSSRRIAPVAMNDKLFVSILNIEGAAGQPHTYTLHRYDLLSEAVTELSATVGRSYMTKTAERDNGVFEGEVIAWDSATEVLANATGEIINLGSPEGVISAAGETTAITSVFGQTSGVPLAGIGNLVALRGMPNSHNWHLIAGGANTPGGLDYVDQVPTSAWIYE